MIEASLIIVNYNTTEHVVELMRHFFCTEECPEQIIIVDNSPEGGLQDRREIRHARVRYMPLRENIGFAAAVNQGLKLSRQDLLILLNPDARPESGCLTGLIDTLKKEPQSAIVGPRLIPFENDGSEVPSATYMDPTLLTTLLEYTALWRLIPRSRDWLAKKYFVSCEEDHKPIDCAMVQGACFVFRKKWAEKIGEFDDGRFFLYWEETDFCRRVRQKGGRVLYCPEFHCRHLGGASTNRGGQDMGHYWRSLYAYHRKHHGAPYAWLLRILLTAGMGAEYIVLWMIHLARGTKNPKLISDMETLQARLREQL